ncbi:hypothetical protein LZ30DRAFT_46480 [Colletotrichum cereale]|nr:hypothetical protein LZ30DRAFT_46480 [Colletotrichum cereale]
MFSALPPITDRLSSAKSKLVSRHPSALTGTYCRMLMAQIAYTLLDHRRVASLPPWLRGGEVTPHTARKQTWYDGATRYGRRAMLDCSGLVVSATAVDWCAPRPNTKVFSRGWLRGTRGREVRPSRSRGRGEEYGWELSSCDTVLRARGCS